MRLSGWSPLSPVWRNTVPTPNGVLTYSMMFSGLQTHWIKPAGKRGAWSQAHRQVKTQPKRKSGCPAIGETAPEKKSANRIKNIRYALLKNSEHRSENQKVHPQFLTKANP